MINHDDKILMGIVMIINIMMMSMIFYSGTIEYDEMLPWLELLQSGTFSGKIMMTMTDGDNVDDIDDDDDINDDHDFDYHDFYNHDSDDDDHDVVMMKNLF